MKAIPVIVLVLAVYAASAVSDTCVKIKTHTDEYYYGGEVNPAADRTIEFWFGEDKMAYVTERRKYLINVADGSLAIVNMDDSTYASTSLPLDWSALVSQETLSFLTTYARHGEVTETSETKTIGRWKCKRYDVYSWIDVEDGRYDEREQSVWASKDIALDWDLYHRVNPDALRLANYDDHFIGELLEIDGFNIEVEAKVYVRGFCVNSYERVIDVQDKPAPPGIYTVPGGFREKTELTIQDLRG
jgi:hypothetical protein